jgi:hexulose-6-phosphate isomerase
MNQNTSRRGFLKGTLAGAVGIGAAQLLPGSAWAQQQEKPMGFKKAVKFTMIKTNGSIEDKFNLIKSLGFDGVEMDSPSDVNVQEAVAAQEKTGIKIHGVIDSIHWKDRLSSPDAAVRARGLDGLRTAIKDAKAYGASTVLLVPGRVSDKAEDDETFDKVWSRSQEEIRKVLPSLDGSGTKIAIEVVWNNFITKPEQLVKYVDEFQNPNVGAYFDVSNMVKYGVPPAEWIRALGPRMLKFDFKGYSNAKKWVKIGEGDENWPEVRKALAEIGYHGWATSEVAGGDAEALKEVKQRMDQVLG